MIGNSNRSFAMSNRVNIFNTFLNTIPIAAVILSLIYWVPVIWLKFYTLHDYVFDLGVFYSSLHAIFYQHTPTIIYQYAAGSTLRIILSPLSCFNSFLVLLYLQLALVMGSAITVFLISRRIFSNRYLPVIMSIVYLLYFPINGSIFYDVHAQTFFLPFMLLAYYLEIRGSYKSSIVAFLLAGLTRFPIIGIVLLYSILDFIYNFRTGRKSQDMKEFRRRLNFDVILFLISFLITGLQYYSNTYVLRVSALGNIHYVAGMTPFSGPIGTYVITVLIFTAPLLLLPLFSSEFSVLLWALFGFAFYTDYNAYLYPAIFTDQYSALFVPLIFISLLAGLRGKRDTVGEVHFTQPKGVGKISSHTSTVVKIAIAMVIFAVIFQPYSPISSHTNISMNISNYTSSGTVNEVDLQSVINLIPHAATGVIFGNDMPEVLIQAPYDNGSLVSGTINGYPLNWNQAFFDSNSTIQYITGVPGSMLTTPEPGAYNEYQITRIAMSSGDYGVLAEYHGVFLLSRGYGGSPELFQPVTYSNVSYSHIVVLNGNYQYSDGLLMHNISNGTVIPSESLLLYPGHYELHILFTTVNISSPANIQLRISASDIPGNIVIGNATLLNGSSDLNVEFNLNNFYANSDIFITGLNFSGTVSLESMGIVQTGWRYE